MIAKIKNCFLGGEKASDSIVSAAFLISMMGLFSRLMGLIRDRVLASKFGAGDFLDAYYAAFKIPDLIFNLLVVGALSAAFVPVFTGLIASDKKKEAWSLVGKIVALASLVLILAGFLLFIFASTLVSTLTFGFSLEKKDLTTGLTRIMLLSPVILGISGIMGGVLNSFKKFFFYSLAPIFYNLGIIIGAVFFVRFWGELGLAYGVILGAFFHLLIQLPEVKRCGWDGKLIFNFHDQNLKRVLLLMLPRTMGLAITQVSFLIVTILASTLQSGSLAVFNFANNIQSVPLGMFGIAFAVAAFPTLSCNWAKKQKQEFSRVFSKTFINILLFAIPFSVIFIVLRAQLVRVILGSGKFDWADTILTFQALGIFALSLFAQCLIPLLARSFYAIGNTKTPFFIGIFSELVNLILALFLIKEFQLLGLVWAFSVSSILYMFLLLLFLKKKIGDLGEDLIIVNTWKVIFASVFMALVMQGAKYIGYLVNMQTFLGVFIQTIISLVSGVVVFCFVGKLLKIEGLGALLLLIRKKFFNVKALNKEVRDEIEGL